MQVWALELTRTDTEGYLLLGEWADRDECRIPFLQAAWEILPHGEQVEATELGSDGSILLVAGSYGLTLTPREE